MEIEIIQDSLPLPCSEYKLSTQEILEFKMSTGNYDDYKTYPYTLKYKSIYFTKTGFNSDSLIVVYKSVKSIDYIPLAQNS